MHCRESLKASERNTNLFISRKGKKWVSLAGEVHLHAVHTCTMKSCQTPPRRRHGVKRWMVKEGTGLEKNHCVLFIGSTGGWGTSLMATEDPHLRGRSVSLPLPP